MSYRNLKTSYLSDSGIFALFTREIVRVQIKNYYLVLPSCYRGQIHLFSIFSRSIGNSFQHILI